MNTDHRNRFLICLLIILAAGCKHPYDTPATRANNNFLVASGFINTGPDASTTITLTRTQNLADTGRAVPELNAILTIEASGGGSYGLQEAGNGNYSIDHLNLGISETYRLRIITANGNNYLSDYVPAKQAPPIDSLNWKQENDASIYISTHDPTNNTRYYRWDFIETWNYLSLLSSPWGVKNGMVFAMDTTNQTDSCWRTANSTNIILASSITLSADIISHFTVAIVPQNDEKISNRYSILVRQYALTADAYQFQLRLQKNTQQLGNLFDPQPSQLNGNIHSLANPDETVIGYISAGSVQEKRIFIGNEELHNWHYIQNAIDCQTLTVPIDSVNALIFDYPDSSYSTYYFLMSGPMVIAKKPCLDCTRWGGTNKRPSFW
jgi:Domain of unknown function (DUF4249)